MELAGINAQELVRYKQSSDYADEGGAVDQPGLDAPGPHMTNYPDGRYEMVIRRPDQAVWDASENLPPVKVA